MLIAQISDTHIMLREGPEPKFAERVKALEAFVAHVNALEEKPDVVLHTGDVTHGGEPEYYQTVKSVMQALSVPVHFALGNRDLADNLVAGLGELGGATCAEGFLIYAVEDYAVRLIAMDTQHRERNIGTTCSVRLRLLDELLKQQPDKPTALFMHHPPFRVTTAADPYQFQFDDPVLAEAFLDLIAGHKQVVHMFCGHMHRQYSVDMPTCRATCVPSLPVDNRLGDFAPDLAGRPLFQMHRWDPSTMRFATTLHAAAA